MFDFGLSHILLFALIALVVIGPKQLPDVARNIGRFLNELKRASGEFGKTLMDTQASPPEPSRSAAPKAIEARESEYQKTVEPEPFTSDPHETSEPAEHQLEFKLGASSEKRES